MLKPRVAVIGLGRMGLRHIAAAEQSGCAVVSVFDSSRDACQNAAGSGVVGANHIATSYDSLLAEKPDVVIVATTAPSHAELVIGAIEGGVERVLCEKPMATSLAACDSMIVAAEHSGAKLAVNHQMRFMDQYRIVRDECESAQFGGLSSVMVTAGNFGLAMNGVHYFELARWLFGGAPATVTAWLDSERVPNPRGPAFEDWGGVVHLQMPDARTFTLNARVAQGHGVRATYAGPFGIAVSDELRGTFEMTTRSNADDRSLPTTRYGCEATTRLIDVEPADVIGPTSAVLQSLITGTDFPSGVDGRNAFAVLVAAHASHAAGNRPVAMDEVDAHADSILHVA